MFEMLKKKKEKLILKYHFEYFKFPDICLEKILEILEYIFKMIKISWKSSKSRGKSLDS